MPAPLRSVRLLLLASVLMGTAGAWAGVPTLPFTGEDLTILARVDAGETGSPHVFRPLPDLWMWALSGFAGAGPLHAGSLLLHVICAGLVFTLVERLLGNVGIAAAAALVFGLGAGVTDPVVWISACNRPLAGVGALLVLNGLARWGERAGPLLVGVGLTWGVLANEEAYGVALLVVAWLLGSSLLGSSLPGSSLPGSSRAAEPTERRLAWASAAAIAVGFGLHYALLQRVPGEAEAFVVDSPAGLWANARSRGAQVISGWGLPAAAGIALPLAGVALLLAARHRRAALLLGGAWLVSFLPFALVSAQTYYAYPTQAPTAALLVAGAACVARLARLGPRGEGSVALAVTLLLAWGAWGPRAERIAEWRAAGAELAACTVALDALEDDGGFAPEGLVLVNLELSTRGLFARRMGDPGFERARALSFLDAASGFVAPELLPLDAPWFGRRREGSYGLLDPATYLAAVPQVAPFRLYGAVEEVRSLEEARARLAQADFDLGRTCLVEAALGERDLTDAGEVGEFVGLRADPTEVVGSLAVSTAGTSILAVQPTWTFGSLFRISPDQRLFSNAPDRRILRLQATGADGVVHPTFPCNGLGFGVLLPPGDHALTLRWTARSPAELRRVRPLFGESP